MILAATHTALHTSSEEVTTAESPSNTHITHGASQCLQTGITLVTVLSSIITRSTG